MNRCDFFTLESASGRQRYVCRRCGRETGWTPHAPDQVYAACRRGPTVRERLSRYASAVVRWIAAGRPERAPEEVSRIYDEVCKPCEKFSGDSCTVCGCKIKRDAGALRNKIAMGTESCPIGKW